MDVGDMLNALAAVFVIMFAILLSINLPFLPVKYFLSYNPFSIYQTALSLNYIYTYPGDYNIEINYDGKYLWRYELRISNKSTESYVSIGECFEKNHLIDIASDLLTAALYTVSVRIPVESAKISDVLKTFIFYTLDLIKANIIFTEISNILSLFISSGGDINKFIKSFIVTYQLNSPLEAISAKAAEYGTMSAEIFARNMITALIRFTISRVLSFSGVGILVGFLVNFVIGLIDNIYDWFRGMWDVGYNCLKEVGFGKQVIYNERENILYSQNNHLHLNFKDVDCSGSKMARVVDNWLYKVIVAWDNEKCYLDKLKITSKGQIIDITPLYLETS